MNHKVDESLSRFHAVDVGGAGAEEATRAMPASDAGFTSLEGLLGGPMEVGTFLRMAISIASALGTVHQDRLVHKDVKPANILVNLDGGEARFTGFGLSSRMARERTQPRAPESIAGTLAYMAPEQTGRMNRSIDSRSDLYALGVTFYQMVTGCLPFTATDPMEWVHCHIAKKPAPPGERHESVPAPVSAIIMRLLVKTPEDRYQTAGGVGHDLRRCLAAWEAERRIEDFPLGEHDMPDQFLIPEKLYGRSREVETLLAAFDRIVTGAKPELVLVSGYSGVGKSSVVNELHKSLVPPRGLFASGKFDQYKRDIPYATLAQAFQSLVQRLLGKSEADLAPWRDALRDALGPYGRLIIELVPELELIVGHQPPAPDLPPEDARRRFQVIFRRFIGVFARQEHPLTLFLDDLQWLDAATLDLLEDLLTGSDLRHLMLTGAYRVNEVTSVHPLRQKLEAIEAAGGKVVEITLAPLTPEHLRQLISDALRCETGRAAPLAQLVHEKTGGNPFFARRFIASLAEEGMLIFEHDAARWRWDLGRIQAKGYTDNLADLMVGKLIRLTAETQRAVQQLACLGNAAAVGTLALVFGTKESKIHSLLEEAVVADLLERRKDSYRFIHDRIQEAAYLLVPESVRPEAHLRIGRLLAAHTPPQQREAAIYEIVNQLNRGAPLITSDQERVQLAELNLIAGKRAKASNAYVAALNYLVVAAAMLDGSWDPRRDLLFSIEFHRAECEFLTGERAAAEQRLTTLASHAVDMVELAAVACLRMDLHWALAQSPSAVAVCLDYLRRLGHECSPCPSEQEVRREYDRIGARVGSRAIEALIELPLMSDPVSLATLDVLTKAILPAWFTDTNLGSWVLCRAVNLSLEHGHSDGSCSAYEHLAMIAGPRFGDYWVGSEFGRLGYELVEKRGLRRFQSRTYMVFGNVVLPWTTHLRAGRDLVRRAFDTACQNGDLSSAVGSGQYLITNLLAAGDPLAEVEREAVNALEFATKARFGLTVDNIATQLGLIRTLRGSTPIFGCFNDDRFDEASVEQKLSSNPVFKVNEFWYWTRKTQARFLAGNYRSAVDASIKAHQLIEMSPSFLETAECHFYGALSRAALWNSASPSEGQEHLEALAASHGQLQTWAERCPENFENRAALVGAEVARIEGRVLDAELLYEKAIRSAGANGFIHNEAVACEVAARFYATRGFDRIADTYLRDARHGYLRWGADGKVRQLDEEHPRRGGGKPERAPKGMIAASVESLEIATVLKVSQAIAGEIVLEKLLDTLMRIALEEAGAERSLLIVPHGTEIHVQAEATTSGEAVIVRLEEAIAGGSSVPEAVLSYVMRTRETVILDDASTHPLFSADAYVRDKNARSILCLPLIGRAKLTGVLYLENNLAPRVFSPARIAVLRMLASQAAMSLESSRLYRDLAEREARIRRLVDANIIGVLISDSKGEIIESNDAFLKMVGYTREELVSGRVSWRDMTPARWKVASENGVTQVRTTGACKAFEKEYYRKDGSCVPVLVGAARFEANSIIAFAVDLTELKRTEETLRRSQHYLTEAQKLTHTGSWAWSPPLGTLIYWSDECYRISGYDPAQGLPSFESSFQRIHPEDQPVVAEAIERAVREKAEFQIEYREVLPDGTRPHIRVCAHPVLDSSGALVEFIGTVMDVSEQKRAEEERREHLWFLESMDRVNRTMQRSNDVEQMMAGVLEEAIAIFGCERACLVYPCDPDTPTWRVVAERTTPQYEGDIALDEDLPTSPEGAEMFRRLLLQEEPLLDPKLRPDRRAQFCIASMITFAVRPKGDRPYMFAMHQCSHTRVWTAAEHRLFEEIGRRLGDALTSVLAHRNLLANEEELRRSRAYLAEAQRVSHTGSWAWNPASNAIVYWSDECYRVLGHDPAMGLPSFAQLMEDVHPEDRPQLAESLETAVRTRSDWEAQYRLVNFADGMRAVHCMAHPILDGAGQVLEYVGTVMDITDQKRAEEERREHLWFLESMDRVNRAMQRSNDIEQMMAGVLEEAIAIFGCERACLVYPCDPETPTWRVVAERTTPQYEGDIALDEDLPTSPEGAEMFRRLLLQEGPLVDPTLRPDRRAQFRIASMITFAVRPKGDRPYMFAMHQCSHARTWTASERRLFEEIARRLEDTLTSLLAHRNLLANRQALQVLSRDLQESKAKLEEAQRLTHVGYYEWDLLTDRVDWSDENYRIYGMQPQECPMDIGAVQERIHPEDWQRGMEVAMGGDRFGVECRLFRPTGEMRIAMVHGDVKRDASGKPYRVFGTTQDITDRKRAEEERKEHLWFLECMDRINRAMQQSNDIELMTSGVVQVALEIFACDRVALHYPCDPDAPTFRTVMEHVSPEYKGPLTLGAGDRSASPDGAKLIRRCLHGSRAVVDPILPPAIRDRFNIASMLATAVRPKGDAPYLLVAHCERSRPWTAAELRVFEEIAGRLADALTSVLAHRNLLTSQEALQALSRDLQESKTKLEEAQRIAHVGYWEWDVSTGQVNWSDETYRIYGMQPQERPIDIAICREKIHPEDWQRAEQAIDGDRFSNECRLLRPTGEVRIALFQGDVKRDALGNPCRMFGTIQDVTDRRRAEDERREHLWFLECMDRVNRAMQHPNDMNGMLSSVLEEALAIFGSDRAWLVYPCDPAAATARVVMEHTRPEYPGAFALAEELPVDTRAAEFLRRVLEGPGASTDLTVWPEMREQFSIQSVIAIAICPQGSRPYLFGLHQCSHARVWTATERRFFEEIARRLEDGLTSVLAHDNLLASEEQLRRSRYYLAEAQKVSHTGSWALSSAKRKHVYMSEECFRIHGLDPAQGPPSLKQVTALMHPEDGPAMMAKLNGAGHEPRHWEAEYRLVNFADGPRTIRIIAHPVQDHSGKDADWIGTVVDITQQKRRQDEIQQLESRLRQAERFEAMGTLAGGIAHDFNNILGAILGFGERALRSVDENSRLHHDLSNVLVAGERGRTLVDRILSFSRGTASKRAPVHVERVARETLNLLQPKLPAHVKLRSQLQAGRAAVLGDAVQIHQLLINLGTNAAHAMTQAGTLTVSLETVEILQERQATVGSVTTGAWVVLRVADQGTGMTREVLERIFDPFFTTKEVGVGTGLGLSLVLRIVTQAGGAIDVQSSPGGGSEFTVYLPRAGDAPEEPEDDSPAMPRGNGQRVMVVDDEGPLLELTTDALSELGYEAVGYGSARAALEAFRSNSSHFEVLITDLRMPGMSGDALIREVRRLRPLLPVILVSGYVGDAGMAPSNSGLADDVLTKPLQAIALATSLARLLDPAAPAPSHRALGNEPRR